MKYAVVFYQSGGFGVIEGDGPHFTFDTAHEAYQYGEHIQSCAMQFILSEQEDPIEDEADFDICF